MADDTFSIDPETLLKPKGAAAFLGVHFDTLRNWRYKRTGPVFYNLASNQIRYKRKDLIAWIDARRGRVS